MPQAQSEESMTWMDDPAFLKQWAALLGQLLVARCTLKVVHAVSRDAGEMWEGVRAWLPLYLMGAVEPYYYPRLRDGIRMRSLYVAPGSCALSSNTVRGQVGEELSILLGDRIAVRALAEESSAYLALCQQLVHPVAWDGKDDAPADVMPFLLESVPATRVEQLGAVFAIDEEAGAFIMGIHPPYKTYVVTEQRLVQAIAEYLNGLPPEVAVPVSSLRTCDKETVPLSHSLI